MGSKTGTTSWVTASPQSPREGEPHDVATDGTNQEEAMNTMDQGLTNTSHRPTRWLTVEQLLEIVPIKKSRLYYLTHTHQIPGVTRIGRTLLFDYDAVLTWLENNREGQGVSR